MGNIYKQVHKITLWGIRFIIYYLTILCPRNKKIWVYNGALDNFIDNEKHCFLYANEHYPEYKHVWLTNKMESLSFLKGKSYSVCRTNSLKGIWLMLRAKVFIYGGGLDNQYLTGGAIRCNLWHGIPLKKIGYDDEYHSDDANSLKGKLIRSYAPDSMVLCTSKELMNIFSHAFNVKKSQIVIGGYYRTIPFFYSITELEHYFLHYENNEVNFLYKLLRESLYSQVIIYMPTFRDAKPSFIDESIPDFCVLNDILKENNFLFLLKLHRACIIDMDLTPYSNIILIDNSIDVYPILPLTDVLITDYSSIFFDYALMNDKRIIYYPYDLDDYKSQSRDLYFNYEEIVGENICYTFDNLMKSIIRRENKSNLNKQYYDAPRDFTSLFDEIILRASKVII